MYMGICLYCTCTSAFEWELTQLALSSWVWVAATLNWLCDQDLDANVRPFTTERLHPSMALITVGSFGTVVRYHDSGIFKNFIYAGCWLQRRLMHTGRYSRTAVIRVGDWLCPQEFEWELTHAQFGPVIKTEKRTNINTFWFFSIPAMYRIVGSSCAVHFSKLLYVKDRFQASQLETLVWSDPANLAPGKMIKNQNDVLIFVPNKSKCIDICPQ